MKSTSKTATCSPWLANAKAAAVASAGPAVLEAAGREIAAAASGSDDDGDGVAGRTVDGGGGGSGSVAPDDLALLWESEKVAWASLLQGSAVSEHLEDLYFEAIQEAVAAWRGKQQGGSRREEGANRA